MPTPVPHPWKQRVSPADCPSQTSYPSQRHCQHLEPYSGVSGDLPCLFVRSDFLCLLKTFWNTLP